MCLWGLWCYVCRQVACQILPWNRSFTGLSPWTVPAYGSTELETSYNEAWFRKRCWSRHTLHQVMTSSPSEYVRGSECRICQKLACCMDHLKSQIVPWSTRRPDHLVCILWKPNPEWLVCFITAGRPCEITCCRVPWFGRLPCIRYYYPILYSIIMYKSLFTTVMVLFYLRSPQVSLICLYAKNQQPKKLAFLVVIVLRLHVRLIARDIFLGREGQQKSDKILFDKVH